MDKEKVLEIVKKHVDLEGMGKELAIEFVKPWLLEKKAKIESGEIDLVKGTDLDKIAALAFIEFLMKQVEA